MANQSILPKSSGQDEKINKQPKFSLFIQRLFFPICIFVISLGAFSEAFILVDDLYNMARSRLSNEVEYELLESVNVNNTQGYLEEMFGEAVVVKQIEQGIDAKYYLNSKFLLTIFYQQDRSVAYTVVAFSDDFTPRLPWNEDVRLGDQTFSELAIHAENYSFDSAKTNRFYAEQIESGIQHFFLKNYLGSIDYGLTSFETESLASIYKADVYEGSGVEQARQAFRAKARPNIYGQGELELEVIQKGLLSIGEFSSYFGL